ncbi:DUF305 domain-containing protein [Pseudonocardia kunmingensis]|uniref:Uncharacterized protein (DUF305 family) n=1 Tax=Pseudonocardia kunmingensis TaxID=630975 RepID=A0A543DKT9_9PSEU|nr:DUF305 domain-containing protein [Pseudonocardia kunmingensis]TQM09946.1 uncharacterized protein (DUF305 family) [Pseudonocardia kunmingensis]
MPTIRTTTRAALTSGALALSLSLALTACGESAPPAATTSAAGAPTTSAPAAASEEHNDADIRFAQMMIPHHRQAIEMAQIAAERADNPEVKALAEQIRSAQDPEIETMTGFLETWGAEVPAEGGMTGMDHSGMDHSGTGEMSGMSGMMTPEQMDQLRSATGADFDTMFLEMMIVHHQGAVTDAERELAEGVNPQAKELAAQIIDAQTAEIVQMSQLLPAS